MSKILETESEGYGPSFAIHGFMRYLGLRPAQLVAYALIYSCTVDRGCYDFGAAVLADWSGTSERTARTTIASLLEMGLIVERGSHVHGTNTVGRALVAAADPVSRAREAWKADHPAPIDPCTAVHLKNLHVKKLPHLQFLHVKILPHMQKFHVTFFHLKFFHLKILPHLKIFHVKELPHLQFLHVKILPHLQFFQVKPPIYL